MLFSVHGYSDASMTFDTIVRFVDSSGKDSHTPLARITRTPAASK
jgi:hypothetical protein